MSPLEERSDHEQAITIADPAPTSKPLHQRSSRSALRTRFMNSPQRHTLPPRSSITSLTDPQRICAGWIAAVAWLGLGIRLYADLSAAVGEGSSILGCVIEFLSYFSTQANILVALSMTLAAARSSAIPLLLRPSAQGALVVYMIVIGVTFELLLRTSEPWLPWLADTIMHVAVPTLYVIYYALDPSKGRLVWWDPLKWLIYPLIYLICTMLRGAGDGRYPYPFIDVAKIGYPTTLQNSLVFLVLFAVLGGAVTLADYWMARLVNYQK